MIKGMNINYKHYKHDEVQRLWWKKQSVDDKNHTSQDVYITTKNLPLAAIKKTSAKKDANSRSFSLTVSIARSPHGTAWPGWVVSSVCFCKRWKMTIIMKRLCFVDYQARSMYMSIYTLVLQTSSQNVFEPPSTVWEAICRWSALRFRESETGACAVLSTGAWPKSTLDTGWKR